MPSIRTIVLPCSIDGIVTGCILAVGRIVGESAALLFTAGAAEVIAKRDRKSTRLNSSHSRASRMPSSA